MEKNQEIETLRAVAILFVLLQHLGSLFAWRSEGFEDFQRIFQFWTGVDLFFCISGFVIARSLLPSILEEGNSRMYWRNIVAFWIRRAYRLLPSAWIWLVFVWLLSIFLNATGTFGSPENNFGDLIASVLNIANIHFSQCAALKVQCGVSSIYWSLSLEEQFYFIFPFVCFIFRKRLPYLLVVIVVIQLVTPKAFHDPLLFSRTGAMAIGVLLAIFSRRPEHADVCPNCLRNPLAAAAFSLTLITMLGLIAAPAWSVAPDYSVTIAAVLSGTLVWLASYGRGFVPSGSRVVQWIGSRSYTLYLVHIPVFLGTREIWVWLEPNTTFRGSYTLRFLLTAVALMLLLTEANFRLVESPLRKRGRRIAEQFLGVEALSRRDDQGRP